MTAKTKALSFNQLNDLTIAINSYDEAINIYKRGDLFARVADNMRGSALQYIKETHNDRYKEFMQSMNIKANTANKLIAHSKLVAIAEVLDEPAPAKATITAELKGKTPEAKLDNYKEIQTETAKEEPTQAEIRTYNKKLSEKSLTVPSITKDYETLYNNLLNDLKTAKKQTLVKTLKAHIDPKMYKKYINDKPVPQTATQAKNTAETWRSIANYMINVASKIGEINRYKYAPNPPIDSKYISGIYKIFGIHNKPATKEELRDLIKQKYKELAKTAHPDLGGKQEDFQKLNEAYKLLLKEIR